MRAPLLLIVVLAGCRGGVVGPIDPTDPGPLSACPTGPHLSVALGVREWGEEQSILRFAAGSFAQCQGFVPPVMEYGDLVTIGGLDDGSEVLGFIDASRRGGAIARVDGEAVTAHLLSEELFPIGISPLSFAGESAVAVVWGSSFGSSSDSGEFLSVHRASDLSELDGWDVSWSSVRAAAPASGQQQRLAVLENGASMQEMRADPGATTLATTGELVVSIPFGSGTSRSLDVLAGEVRVAGDDGVLYWRSGSGNAFLGPVTCRWPATTSTRLPAEGSEYRGALIEPNDPTDLTVVLVSGELEGGSEERSHVYLMRHRGDCEHVFSIADTHDAVAIAWAGR
jgi:hypothetical protein